jgi:hypothetical protein
MEGMVDAKALALTLGVVWGGGVFLLGLLAAFLDWGVPMVELLGSVYLGYGPTVSGSLIGLLWAFVDGAVGGVILAWGYNHFSR